MIDWTDERNLLLNAWPCRLASREGNANKAEREEQTIATALLDMAVACSDVKEWSDWKSTLMQYWPADQPSAFKQLSSIVGPSLAEALRVVLSIHQKGLTSNPDPEAKQKLKAVCEYLGYATWPARPAIIHDPAIQEQARLLCEQYHISSIDIWNGMLYQSKARLDELRISLSNLALATGQENARIGRGNLIVSLAGRVQIPNVAGQRLELPQDEQGLARGWCQWRISQPTSQVMIGVAEREWKAFIWTGERGKMARQRTFMLMTQQSLRRIAGSLVDRSSAGELALRRYRAAGKWMDEATQSFKDRDTLMRGWRKVKTGNRIAWTGLTSGELGNDTALHTAIDNWQWEDRILEAAFWRAPQWDVPVWFQRFLALGSEVWPEHMAAVRGTKLQHAWAFAFEGMVRNKIGYDSSAAKARPSHPMGPEAKQIETFFQEHLSWIIYNSA